MSRAQRYRRNLGRRLPQPLPRRTTTEWVRFAHLREPYGVFSYISDARAGLGPYHAEQLNNLVNWFDDSLAAPTQELDQERFWFRAEAVRFVAQARRLSMLVAAAGIPIVELRTARVPGKVIWRDARQVAVRTFRDVPPKRAGRILDARPRLV